MTLTTRIRIVEPTSVLLVFDEARRLIGAQESTFDHKDDRFKQGNRCYRNHPGQGFPALVWVDYGADGPLQGHIDNPEHSEDDCAYWYGCESDNHRHPPRASVEVAFDTSYGYSYRGANCNDLHAYLIVELGRWLNQRGLTWYWKNEYISEWFKGLEDNEALKSFGDPIKGARLELANY